MARCRRITSSSPRRPIRIPGLDFGAVAILSTIRRQAVRDPSRSFGSTSNLINGASIASVVNPQIVMEFVASKPSSCMMTAGGSCPRNPAGRRRSISRLVSFVVPVRDRIDERLILAIPGAVGHGKGLAVRLRLECRRTDVRYPHLNWTQPLQPQPRTMLSYLHAGRLGHDSAPCQITCNLPCPAATIHHFRTVTAPGAAKARGPPHYSAASASGSSSSDTMLSIEFATMPD